MSKYYFNREIKQVTIEELLDKFKDILDVRYASFEVSFYNKDLQLNLGEITFRLRDKDYFITPYEDEAEECSMLLFLNDKSRYIDISSLFYIYDVMQEYEIKYIVKRLIKIYIDKVFE